MAQVILDSIGVGFAGNNQPDLGYIPSYNHTNTAGALIIGVAACYSTKVTGIVFGGIEMEMVTEKPLANDINVGAYHYIFKLKNAPGGANQVKLTESAYTLFVVYNTFAYLNADDIGDIGWVYGASTPQIQATNCPNEGMVLQTFSRRGRLFSTDTGPGRKLYEGSGYWVTDSIRVKDSDVDGTTFIADQTNVGYDQWSGLSVKIPPAVPPGPLGNSAGTYTFFSSVAGKKNQEGSSSSTSTFDSSAIGETEKFGNVESQVIFLGSANGIRESAGELGSTFRWSSDAIGSVEHRGNSSDFFNWSSVAVGLRKVFKSGQGLADFSFDGDAIGEKKTFGSTQVSVFDIFQTFTMGSTLFFGESASSYSWSQEVIGKAKRKGISEGTFNFILDKIESGSRYFRDTLELRIHRLGTSKFISADTSKIELIPRKDLIVAGTKTFVDLPKKEPQNFRIIWNGDSGISRNPGQEGGSRKFDFILVGEYNADISIGDFWTSGDQEFRIEYIYPDNEYEVKAGGVSYGPRPG